VIPIVHKILEVYESIGCSCPVWSCSNSWMRYCISRTSSSSTLTTYITWYHDFISCWRSVSYIGRSVVSYSYLSASHAFSYLRTNISTIVGSREVRRYYSDIRSMRGCKSDWILDKYTRHMSSCTSSVCRYLEYLSGSSACCPEFIPVSTSSMKS
jgi:hypothetical protein